MATLMLGGMGSPVVGTVPGEVRSPTPLADESVWSDSLDDMGGVYVPPGGLFNVEVSGGDGHLVAGEMDGWIASAAIACPSGHRYDLVYLEVDTPGDSYVKVSVLDATQGPSQAGFANLTIPGYRKVPAADVSLNHIDPVAYPEIRIQVNLYSDGIDHPRLLAWTVFFVDEDEWQDEFLGTGKLQSWGGLNVTGGTARVRIGEKVLDVDDYEPYPAVAVPRYRGLNMFYRNSSAGYGYRVEPTEKDYWAVEIDDMNGDGYLDVVCSDGWTWGDIYWGSEDGVYTEENRGPLNLPALDFATGDFDGDGWKDIVGAVPRGWGSSSVVMLNQGDGVFIKDVNISITGLQTQFAAAGDINGDGYDDIVLNTPGTIAYVFFGGPYGPNPTPDAQVQGWFPEVADVNGDGYDDIIEFARYGMMATQIFVYLGGPEFDTVRDHFMELPIGNVSELEVGDINGDGFSDIMVGHFGEDTYMHIVPGSASGWDANASVRLTQGTSWYEMDVGDVNKDGYDDIVYNHGDEDTWEPGLAIAYGGEEFPTEPDFYRPFLVECGPSFNDVALVIPKPARYPMHPRGSLITEDIYLPEGKKWDILHMDVTLPKDTWSTVSVIDLNGRPIAGLDQVEGTSLDLSGIDPDLNTNIRVQVRIGSWANTTTPILDRLTVTWIDRDTWGDQFYSTTRVERALNMAVLGGSLGTTDPTRCGPTILFPSFQGDGNEYLPTSAYSDAGGADYLSQGSTSIPVKGACAVDVEDIDDDGHKEMVFAVYRTEFDTYRTKSPLYAGSPIGPGSVPVHMFPTEGATDVLLRDLNGDGHWDVVFSQERNMASYHVDSVLFWGSDDGWSDTPDVRFKTRGASGVGATDLNGDHKLDLVFSCFSDDTGTSTDSMVFLQEEAGFSGSNPSYQLPTTGARAVAVGDLDGDTKEDLVFACQRDGGVFEISSRIYWSSPSGGFRTTPTDLPTVGAADVKMDDLDGDDDLDLVFANMMNDTHSHDVPSYVYLNDGSGGYSTVPDVELPTTGACAVAVGDIDGAGWKDLVFACEQDGDTYMVDSCLYLGGASGYDHDPDVMLPTYGASAVRMVYLDDGATGGYLSKAIVPEDTANLGAFHTLRYTATLGPSMSGTLRLVDGETWEVLAETAMASGSNEWMVRDLVKVKAHPTVRIAAVLSGLDGGGISSLDDIWLNWTDRVVRAPRVDDLQVGTPNLKRTLGTTLTVVVFDEYDLTSELLVTLEHRPQDSSESWRSSMLGDLVFNAAEGVWMTNLTAPADATVGLYMFRVTVTDMDSMVTSTVITDLLEVLNNVPSAPTIRFSTDVVYTDTMLLVEIVEPAADVDAVEPATYRYRWFRDGVLVEQATASNLLAGFTSKGENWSVEVRAWDGLEEGPPVIAWITILNSPPSLLDPPSDLVMDEDMTDKSLDMAEIFIDADEDQLSFSLAEEPDFLTVTIEPTTGVVTIDPADDWYGEEELTFVADDGEGMTELTVLVTVSSVNDVPRFLEVDDEPVTGDQISITMTNGETRVVTYSVIDVEDDIIWSAINPPVVELDESRKEIRITAAPDFVGTIEFTLAMWDLVSPDDKVSLDFVVTVVNVNDPMSVPRITSPVPGRTIELGATVTLEGDCTDPDCQFGQELTFTWSSNISGVLGSGSTVTHTFSEAGTHLITLTVSDGEFEKSATVTVHVRAREVEPPPEEEDGGGGGISTGVWLAVAVVAVLVIVGVVFLMMRGRGDTPERGVRNEVPPHDYVERELREPEVPGDGDDEKQSP